MLTLEVLVSLTCTYTTSQTAENAQGSGPEMLFNPRVSVIFLVQMLYILYRELQGFKKLQSEHSLDIPQCKNPHI